MPNCFSVSSCCATAAIGDAVATMVAAAKNSPTCLDMTGSLQIALWRARLGARWAEVISEKRDFYGRRVLSSAPEKRMQDRTVSFGRYRLDPGVGLMSGARHVHLTPKAP